MSLVHLHRHSEFSQNYAPDGMGSADEYAARAAELGQTALGHTDHATLGGSLHHIKACREHGLVPVCGVEAYFRPNRRHTKEDGVDPGRAWHLCLHAGSHKGWQSLVAATSAAFTTGDKTGQGFYGKPVMDWEVVERFNEGLYCSTACVYSPIAEPFLRGDEKLAVENFLRLRDIFGDRLWLEIMPHDYEPQRPLNEFIVNLGAQYGVGVIATQDVHMVRKEHAPTALVAQMDSTGQTFEKRQAKHDAGEDTYGSEATTLYLTSEDEMRQMFADHHAHIPAAVVDEAIRNTGEVVKSMRLWMLDSDDKFPQTDGDPLELLDKWCWEGLKRIGRFGDEEYEKRWKYERSVLVKNGVVPYFVIVGELVRWAKSDLGLPKVGEDGRVVRDADGNVVYDGKKKPIRVGLGRGSAAGCLISYLVGIVQIDPIAYGLLFERFLNPDRKGMPDIDLDFSSAGRELVKEYLRRLYGYDHVADVVAHQTWAPRALVRDLGRIYGVPYPEIEKVNATIDPVKDKGWAKVREQNPALAAFCKKYPELDRDAEVLDEHIHRKSKHAAAVVVTKDPVTEHIPLELSKPKNKGERAAVVTAWSNRADFEIISDFGHLKLDLLGVEDLDRQDYAVEMIRRQEERDRANPFLRRAVAVVSRPDPLELEVLRDPDAADPRVLEAFAKGLTIGVFQFHTGGMTALLKAIKPTNVLHLGIANALYRPGAMSMAYEFAKRKNGEVPESEWYWHPSVKPYMEETCGVLAFQEQVMAICKGLGNFTGGQADGIRKGISKWYRLGKQKCIEKLREAGFEQQWFKGCEENGLPRDAAELIWNNILDFAGYGFNKSHSMSYALQAYQDMDLKVNDPHAFYAAILSMPDDDKGWMASVVREARHFRVDIKPPHVNHSELGFTADGKQLRYGFLAIKNLGDAAAWAIMDEREKGMYGGYEDFARRLPGHAGGTGMSLIKANAFEGLDARDWLLSQVPKGEVIMARFDCGWEARCISDNAAAKAVCKNKECPNGDHCHIKGTRRVTEHWTVAEHLNHNRKLKNPRPVPPEQTLPTTRQLMDWEKETLGVLVSTQPTIVKYWDAVEPYVDSYQDFQLMGEGDDVQVAGEIVGVKKITTKKGQPMAFLDLANGTEHWSVTLFTGEWLRFADVLEEADSVIVAGRKNVFNDRESIICNRLQNLEHFVREQEG